MQMPERACHAYQRGNRRREISGWKILELQIANPTRGRVSICNLKLSKLKSRGSVRGIPKLNAIMLTGEPRLSCAICEIRKEKRFCPAVHGRICPQCCGEQREVTLDCPSDCPYLLQAREHEKPRSSDQIDPAALFLQVEVSDQFMYEKEHLLMGLTYALAKAARADRSLHDQDLIAALSVLGDELRAAGELRIALRAAADQRIAAQGRGRGREHGEGVSRGRAETCGYSTLRDSDVLKALVFLVRLAHGRTSGRPKSRAFVEFLFAQFPEKESAVVTPQEAGSRIILP